MSSGKKLTPLAQRFLQPANATHRPYEALRAYFIQGRPAAEVAARFGYTYASFRALAHQFRQNPSRPFFLTPVKGPHAAPKRQALRDRVIALRKQNLSIYDISRALSADGHAISPVAVDQVLKAEGFTRLPRPRDEDRPPASRPSGADAVAVQPLTPRSRTAPTHVAGLVPLPPTLAPPP